MRSWHLLQFGVVMQSEFGVQNVSNLISFYLWAISDVMAFGGREKHLDLVPNKPLSSSMNSMCVALFLVHVRMSTNKS
jgi:hypothetical protein